MDDYNDSPRLVAVNTGDDNGYLKQLRSDCCPDCLKAIEPHIKKLTVDELKCLGKYLCELGHCLCKNIAEHITIEDFDKAKKDGYDELPSLIESEGDEEDEHSGEAGY